ncbi:hypothetical protein [Plantibacter sp. LMC-P-059a]|uniref:hypothetical protein n=1 Tax=Plantibacter sp. LMC-P-059a TaxID=3040297 RepID=UPI00254B984F|nr:hypothetical protein [Plantibacter sp. LMC-P-059a]
MTAQPDTAPDAPSRPTVPVAALRVLGIVAWASLIAFVVLSIGLPLIGVGTFMGTDILFRFAPWASAGGSTEVGTNAMIGDTIDSGVPQMWTIVEAARHGFFAEWLPYQAGGSELGGLPNSGLYSPISFGWWFLPVAVAPGFTKLVEMIVVTLGCSLFLRRLGVPHQAWPIASVVFLASGFMISWTNWPQTRVAAFIPLLFWALDRAAVRRRLLDIVPLGLVLAGMLLGGFPAIVGYALYAGAAYVLARAIVVHRRFWKVITAGLVSAAGVVLGFLLSAWTLLPFALNAVAVLDFSGRRQGPENHLSIDDLLSAFVPSLVGEVSSGDTWGNSSPVERLSYVGAAAVVLAVVALLLQRRRGGRRDMSLFLAVALILSGVLVYLGGPVLGTAQQLPIFDSNRIGRLRVMLGFFVAILAGVGFGRLLERGDTAPVSPPTTSRRPLGRWLWGLATLGSGIAAATLLAVALQRAVVSAPERFTALLETQVLWTVVLLAVAAALVVIVLATRRGGIRIVALCFVPLLVAAPAVLVADTWWPKSDTASVYPDTPTTRFLQQHLGESRYASVDHAMLTGTNSMYRVRSLGGHTFQTVEWKSLLLRLDTESLASATYSTLNYPSLVSSIESPILDRLAVKYVVMEPNLPVPGRYEDTPASEEAVPIGDGEIAVSTVRTGPVRSLSFPMLEPVLGAEGGTTLEVTLVDPVTEQVLASTSTWYRTIEGQRSVAIDGSGIAPDASWRAEISIDHGQGRIAADALEPEAAAVSLNRPMEDGLTVAHTGDATVVERATALDRVRWASDGLVERDPSRRVSLMEDPVLPSTTVLLEDPDDLIGVDPTATTADSAPTTASDADVEVRDQGWDLNRTVVDVDADDAGWVVFADSLRRPGWSVTVDGVASPLVDAEQAGAAVRVEAGEHRVELAYRTPGLDQGITATRVGVGLSVLIVIGTLVIRWGRRARTTAATDEPEPASTQ